jgi:hypothetical protein
MRAHVMRPNLVSASARLLEAGTAYGRLGCCLPSRLS